MAINIGLNPTLILPEYYSESNSQFKADYAVARQRLMKGKDLNLVESLMRPYANSSCEDSYVLSHFCLAILALNSGNHADAIDHFEKSTAEGALGAFLGNRVKLIQEAHPQLLQVSETITRGWTKIIPCLDIVQKALLCPAEKDTFISELASFKDTDLVMLAYEWIAANTTEPNRTFALELVQEAVFRACAAEFQNNQQSAAFFVYSPPSISKALFIDGHYPNLKAALVTSHGETIKSAFDLLAKRFLASEQRDYCAASALSWQMAAGAGMGKGKYLAGLVSIVKEKIPEGVQLILEAADANCQEALTFKGIYNEGEEEQLKNALQAIETPKDPQEKQLLEKAISSSTWWGRGFLWISDPDVIAGTIGVIVGMVALAALITTLVVFAPVIIPTMSFEATLITVGVIGAFFFPFAFFMMLLGKMP